MKKITIGVTGFVIVLTFTFYIFTEGKGSCKLCGSKGRSSTLNESIERNTFVKKMSPKVVKNDDSLKIQINEGVVFFIEKCFRYGDYDAGKTIFLNGDNNFKYQLIVDLSNNKGKFKQEYGSFSKKTKKNSNKFMEIPDTIKYPIVTLSPPHDSIYEVGELHLFDSEIISSTLPFVE